MQTRDLFTAVRLLLAVLTAALLAPHSWGQVPEVVTFYGDHTFDSATDEYFNVHMEKSAHALVLDGRYLNAFRTYSRSTADVRGGWVNSLDGYFDSYIEVHPGAFINTYLSTSHNAVLDLFGGRMPDRYLLASDNSVVNLYVCEYKFRPGDGKDDDGLFTGKWAADGQDFVLPLRLPETYSHVRVHLGPLAGDANGDGLVDLGDFGVLKNHFGSIGSVSEGDFNGDGRVDLSDFGRLKANFGKSTTGAAAVSEPSSFMLGILGLAAAAAYRRNLVRFAHNAPRPQAPSHPAAKQHRPWAMTADSIS